MTLSKEDCQDVLDVFLERHPVRDKLHFVVAQNEMELFTEPVNFYAGYRSLQRNAAPYQGIVQIAADKFYKKNDLYMVINHEVLGHYGLNTFSPQDKKLLLDAIIANKDHEDFKLDWEKVKVNYGHRNIYEQAEEIFARATEDIFPENYPKAGEANEKGMQAFNDVCYLKKPLTLERMIAITDMVALGIRENTRQQQTFPDNDITVLSRQLMHQEPDDPEPEMTM